MKLPGAARWKRIAPATLFLLLIFSPVEIPARQSQSPNVQSETPGNAQVQSPPAEQRPAFIVVLDPGHGGADSGARSSTGQLEKDWTLRLSQAVRGELERDGIRSVLTRDGDTGLSFDDRSAVANGIHGAIYLSLHVGSTGAPGTVRTYVYPATGAEDEQTNEPQSEEQAGRGLVSWREAQQQHVADSRKLGDLLQVEISQRFSHSPELSNAFPIRDLRSVVAPAVAIEISNISDLDQNSFARMASLLAAAVAHGVLAFEGAAKTARQ